MSHETKYRRWERQLSLLTAIGRPSGVTRAAARTDIPAYADYDSPETFRRAFERDVASLRDAGYPILVDGDVYRIAERAPIIAPLNALDVGLVRSLLTRIGRSGGLKAAAHTGMAKILASSASRQVAPRFVRAAIPVGDEVVTVARALQYRKSVTFAYEGSRRREYTLEPARLFVADGAYYASGRARAEGGEWGRRTFKVSRMAPGSLTVGPPATQPRDETPDVDVFAARDVTLAVRPGAFVPALACGHPRQPPPGTRVPEGWRCIGLDRIERRRLCEILGSYGRDVKLLGGQDVLSEWRGRLDHLVRLTDPASRSGAAS